MPTSVLGTVRLWWHISHPWMACTSLRKGQALKLWDLRLPFGWWWSWHWLKGCSLGPTCVVTIKSFVQCTLAFQKALFDLSRLIIGNSWQRWKGTMPFRIRAMICLQVNRIFSWYIFDKKDRREKTDLLTTPGTGDPDWRFTVPWMFGGFWGSTLPMSQVRSLLTGSNVYLPWKLEQRMGVIITK